MPLHLENLSLARNGVRYLDRVDATFRRGRLTTVIGRTLAGKTTLLRTLAGLQAPDSGDLKLDGVSIASVPVWKRDVAMVYQQFINYSSLRVYDNIASPMKLRGEKGIDQHVRSLAEKLHIEMFLDRYPSELSGGQQQRVALARALVFHPDIVLLDEPMAALDKKLRGQMQIEIMHIARKVGATVVSVTHDQEEALVMSDRIAIFRAGRLAQIGTPQELYTRPNSEFVADFIGEANLLRGTARREAGTCRLEGAGWQAILPAGDPRAPAKTAAVTVVLRPEVIALAAEGERPANALVGTIEDRIYLGVEYRLIVRLADGSAVQVRSRELGRIAALAQGDAVTLSWRDADFVVIPG